MRQMSNMPSSVVSSHSMHLGVLATAAHAIQTGTIFSVFYKPRTSGSEFIVSVNNYLEAKVNNFSVGTRFRMKFEGDEVPERRYSGTIIGVCVNSSSVWADFEWRSLKVNWDEPSTIIRPDKVSPWELEPLVQTNSPTSKPSQKNKRPRPPFTPAGIDLIAVGMWNTSAESPSALCTELQHGGDRNSAPKFSCVTNANSLGFGGNSALAAASNQSSYWSHSFGTAVNKESAEKKQSTGCRLFGIKLVNPATMNDDFNGPTPSSRGGIEQVVQSLEAESNSFCEPSNNVGSDVPLINCNPEKTSQICQQELQSKQIRTCTKVHMQGIAVGRAVDLTRFDCYVQLFERMEEMFDIKGELSGSTKKWQVVYTDDEDNMMMVGDDPWNCLCGSVFQCWS